MQTVFKSEASRSVIYNLVFGVCKYELFGVLRGLMPSYILLLWFTKNGELSLEETFLSPVLRCVLFTWALYTSKMRVYCFNSVFLEVLTVSPWGLRREATFFSI